jgi:hypothetical protein
MAVEILPRVNVAANTGDWVRLSTTRTGEIPVALYNYTSYNLVYNATTLAEAQAEASANRIYLQNANVTVYLSLDLTLTWVRSSTGSTGELFILRQD